MRKKTEDTKKDLIKRETVRLKTRKKLFVSPVTEKDLLIIYQVEDCCTVIPNPRSGVVYKVEQV